MRSSHEVQAAKELADEYDIGRVMYVFRTNPKAFKQAIKEKMKEMKTFNKAKKLKEGRKLSSHQKKAILIAIQMSGDMTGAAKKIERIKKGLSNDKKVKDALRLANESINEGTRATKGFQKAFKTRKAFMEAMSDFRKKLGDMGTDPKIFKLEGELYKFDIEFQKKSAKLLDFMQKLAKSSITEGKINEIDYGNIFADMGDKLDDFKTKVVKPGMRLYNKGKAKFYMRDLYKSLEKCVDLCDMMNLTANESVSVNEEIAKGKGVQKIFDIHKNGYGKLGGKMLDSLSAGLFTQLYDRAPENIQEKMNKMNEKRLYIVIGKMWNKFGKNVRLSS